MGACIGVQRLGFFRIACFDSSGKGFGFGHQLFHFFLHIRFVRAQRLGQSGDFSGFGIGFEASIFSDDQFAARVAE